MVLLGIDKSAGMRRWGVARILRVTAPLGVGAVLLYYGMFWCWIGMRPASHIALWSAGACFVGAVAAWAIPHFRRQGISPLLMRLGAIGVASAGAALIVASPFIVLSENLMLHLGWLGGVRVMYWDGPTGGGRDIAVDHLRWMIGIGVVAYGLIIFGVYLFQRAKKLQKHAPVLQSR